MLHMDFPNYFFIDHTFIHTKRVVNPMHHHFLYYPLILFRLNTFFQYEGNSEIFQTGIDDML